MSHFLFIIHNTDGVNGKRNTASILIYLLCLIGKGSKVRNVLLRYFFQNAFRIPFGGTGLRKLNDIHIAAAAFHLCQTLCGIADLQGHLYAICLFKRLNDITLYDILV